MAREIRAAAATTPAPTPNTNDYKDRLVKLIPSEIVTAYITLQGIISGAAGENKIIFTVITFCLLLALTPVYLNKVSAVTKKGQLLFTTIAFVIWVMASGGFHDIFPDASIFQNNILGSMLLIIYTLAIPLVYRG